MVYSHEPKLIKVISTNARSPAGVVDRLRYYFNTHKADAGIISETWLCSNHTTLCYDGAFEVVRKNRKRHTGAILILVRGVISNF